MGVSVVLDSHGASKKKEESVERMGKNGHSRLGRDIMLGEQAREARIWRAGRTWLWEAH